MELYRIKIYKKAEKDLEEIVLYLNRFYAETALKYYDLMVSAINTLADHPKRCPLVRDETLRMREYRYLLVENYIVFFIIRGNIIQIRRILYSKQQYKNFL